MTNIICDFCKKPIPDATRIYSWEKRHERYDTIKDKDICPDCLKVLEEEMHAELAGRALFLFGEVKQVLEEKIEELGAWSARSKNKVLGRE
jgi:hypothetical protein